MSYNAMNGVRRCDRCGERMSKNPTISFSLKYSDLCDKCKDELSHQKKVEKSLKKERDYDENINNFRSNDQQPDVIVSFQRSYVKSEGLKVWEEEIDEVHETLYYLYQIKSEDNQHRYNFDKNTLEKIEDYFKITRDFYFNINSPYLIFVEAIRKLQFKISSTEFSQSGKNRSDFIEQKAKEIQNNGFKVFMDVLKTTYPVFVEYHNEHNEKRKAARDFINNFKSEKTLESYIERDLTDKFDLFFPSRVVLR